MREFASCAFRLGYHPESVMFQIVYISTATEAGKASLHDILRVSRDNNGRTEVTGFLFFDGVRFLQALEGRRNAVEETMAVIRADLRHKSVVVLSNKEIEAREFGDWAMASRTDLDDDEAMLDHISKLVSGASPSVKATFNSFAEVRGLQRPTRTTRF